MSAAFKNCATRELTMTIKKLHGTVRGKTIELEEEVGVPEGQKVEVQVRTITATTKHSGDGLRRTEGALADDTEWDAIMDEIHQRRKLERRAPAPDLGEP
jgi:hypothetical protein